MREAEVCASDEVAHSLAESVRDLVRSEISADLHDTVLQPLTALVAHLECLQRQLRDPASLDAGLTTCLTLTREAITSIRRTLAGEHVHPHVRVGLPQAIRQHIQPQLREMGLAVRLEVSRWPADVPAEVASALYLAVREAATNVWKHAHAREVRIRLDCQDDRLHVRVRDDGRGFVAPFRAGATTRRGGLGLAGMRRRLAALGGGLVVVAAPGAGVMLDMRVPLSPLESPIEAVPAMGCERSGAVLVH